MKKSFYLDRPGIFFRGLALVILGTLILHFPVSCKNRKNPDIPDEKEKIIYSDTQYRITQEPAIRKASPVKGREYIFIPLRLKNSGGISIIFSTRVCVTAYALPSCENCPHSHDAVMYGKEHIKDFRLFDGIIYSRRETRGWLAFDLPEGSKSVHIDFSTGLNEDECLSFECKI